MTVDRFTLEEKIQNCSAIQEDLETLLYKIGDAPKPATEDELMNMVIGMIEMQKTRREQLWSVFEQLIKDKKLT